MFTVAYPFPQALGNLGAILFVVALSVPGRALRWVEDPLAAAGVSKAEGADIKRKIRHRSLPEDSKHQDLALQWAEFRGTTLAASLRWSPLVFIGFVSGLSIFYVFPPISIVVLIIQCVVLAVAFLVVLAIQDTTRICRELTRTVGPGASAADLTGASKTWLVEHGWIVP